MVEEKDRFGEILQLLERAKEDIYFHNATASSSKNLKRNCTRSKMWSRNSIAPKAMIYQRPALSRNFFWIAVRAAAASGWITGNWKE